MVRCSELCKLVDIEASKIIKNTEHMSIKSIHSMMGTCYNIYALVICNHGPPHPGAGRGIAVEMSGVFTFALSPQCGGNTRDLCYIGKKGGAMKT